MTLNEAREFLKERINPNMVETVLNSAMEEGINMNIVWATFSKNSDDEFICDKTYEELEQAIKDKKIVYGYNKSKTGNQTWTYYYPNINHKISSGANAIYFTHQDGHGFSINSMGVIAEITP